MSESQPKVFVSHASEDKAFVLPLATRLRADGVVAWIDQWEIHVGDSLVDKISEGIAGCDVFLVVLSRISVQKAWVREELNAAFVEALEKKTRLMPLRVDDCEVPLVLKSRLRLDFEPEGDFEDQYRALLAAIFDRVDKPALGTPAGHLLRTAPGYDPVETAVWDALIRAVAEGGYPEFIDSLQLPLPLREMSGNAVREAVDMLENDGLAKVSRFGGRFYAALTPHGWHERAGEVLGIDVHGDESTALASLASDGPCNGEALGVRCGIPAVRLAMALEWLDASGFLTLMKVSGVGLQRYHSIHCTAEGRRAARS